MKIRLSGLMGRQHSWSHTTRNFAQKFYEMGHNIFLHPTDGSEYLSKDIAKYVGSIEESPDFDLTYTLPVNFKNRFLKNSKIKASIFNYESSILPKVWSDHDKYLDLIFPSSNYCKEIFVNAGWDEKKIRVIPLGVDFNYFNSAEKECGFEDRFNFLNISIPHYRKHIDVMIEAYYRAFEGNENVRLMLKTSLAVPSKRNAFECFVPKIIQDIQQKLRLSSYPCLTLITENYKNIGSLYKASDCLVSTTGAEGFGLPMIEAMACGTMVASTNNTGQKDFLTENNSVIIPSYEMGADNRFQYWRPSSGAKIYRPKVSEVADILLNIYENSKSLKSSKEKEMMNTAKKYSWESSAKMMIEEVEK